MLGEVHRVNVCGLRRSHLELLAESLKRIPATTSPSRYKIRFETRRNGSSNRGSRRFSDVNRRLIVFNLIQGVS